ncbi:LORF2 protein, partial [Crocuta crocuta]
NLNRHFSKEDTQMVNKHLKRCSPTLIIKEIQIKTTMSYYFTSIRMAKRGEGRGGEGRGKEERGCGESGTLAHCWWGFKMMQLLWKTVWWLLKKHRIIIGPRSSTSGYISQIIEIRVLNSYLHTHVTAVLFTTAKWWTQPKHPLMDEQINKM